ncbi:MAG: cytidine deaminase, partial [Clostridiales bacterium]|nr:cytidine deaminase [Clostridiales bacterium]
MDKRTSKDNYYLGIADSVLSRSTCLRRKYGAIIV